MKKLLIAGFALIVFTLAVPCLRAQGLDVYGGSVDLQCPNGATGHFYAQEVGNRWWLCDPNGNVYWAASVFSVYEPSIAPTKYGSDFNWGALQTARLKSWGFNTIDTGDGTSGLVLPLTSEPEWPGNHLQPNPMPVMLFYNDLSSYPARGPFAYCSGANLDQTKPFGGGDDPTYWNYSTYPDITIDDPFDPCFTVYSYDSLATIGGLSGYETSPWTLGVEWGEGDYLRGTGAGPSAQDGPTGALNTSPGFATVTPDNNNANLGIAVLLASPWETYNSDWGTLAKRTREVYVKQEMVNWLEGDGQVSFGFPSSSASSSGTVTMTFNSAIPMPYAVGDKINVQACSDANFNGSGLAVLTVSSFTLTYTEPTSDTVSGVNYCVVSMTGAAITGATLSSGTETVTMAVNPYKTGDIVTVAGVSPAAFNTTAGTGCGVTAYSSTTFTCTNGSGSATYASGGMASSGPGYTLANLNTAWGSNYTTWGTTGTNYVDTISTSGSPNDCNRTTWACIGTLSHIPDLYSIWIKDNGTPIAGVGTGNGLDQSFAYLSGDLSIGPYCTPTGNVVVDSSGNVTVTCTQNPVPFSVGTIVSTYFLNDKNYNNTAAPVTAVSGNTFTYVSVKIPATFPTSSIDIATGEAINFSNGAFGVQFPSYQMTTATASAGVVSQSYSISQPPLSVGQTVTVASCADSSFNTAAGANVTLTRVVGVIEYDQSGTGASTSGCVLWPYPITSTDTLTVDYYSGGFAHGTGFLDEAGQHSWVGTDFQSLVQTAGVPTNAFQNDMNDFIYHFVSNWLNVARSVSKIQFPNIMFLGMNEAGGSWCDPPRVPVLRAIGQYVDFAPMGGVACNDPGDQAKLDYAMKYMGNMPIMTWTGVVASADNSVAPLLPALSASQIGANQAARGALYTQQIEEYLNLKVDAGNGAASGQYPFVGLHFWEGGADDHNQGDWGFSTYPNDNPYDGHSGVQAIGTDQWGYPTGGETSNYGNSLSAISSANRLWLNLIPRKQTSGAVGGTQ